MQTPTPTGRPVEPRPSATEAPDAYPKGRRCPRCACFLCIYNEGPLCWPCSPGGDGVLLEVAPGEWRRFTSVELLQRMMKPRQGDELEELMSAGQG